MDTDLLAWLLGGSLAIILLLGVVLLRLTVRSRDLRAKVSELDHALEIEVRMAGHAKPPHRRAVALVINPTKPESEQVVRLVHSTCSRAGMPDPLVLPTTADDVGHSMTQQALRHGADVVIAAGGDGTIRAVGEQLAGSDAALGVIPLGTGNLFARNIGLPLHDLPTCVDEAIHGMSHRVDALELELQRSDGGLDSDFSLVIAGAGLDAQVMNDTSEALKQRAGWLAYPQAGLRHVMGSRHPITISLDGGPPRRSRVRSVLLANCGLLQAGLLLIPSARFDDGRMDAVLFTPRHVWDWAKIVTKTVTRFSAEIPVMTVRQAQHSRVTMAEPLPFQIDGDPVGEVVGVEARLRPQSLVVNGVNTKVLQAPAPRPDSGAVG